MAIEEKVINRMKELAPLNQALAQKIAGEFGLKERSIIAAAKRNEIEYVNKTRVAKNGGPVVSKTDLVDNIAENLGLEVKDLSGLEKATKTALVALAAATLKEDETEETEESEVDEDENVTD